MTEPHMHGASEEDLMACSRALGQVQAFLHGELSESEADEIRHHLDACERCMDDFDVEQAIGHLLRRCHPPATASSQLRMRIVQMRVELR